MEEKSKFLHGIESIIKASEGELPQGVKLVQTVNRMYGNVTLDHTHVGAVSDQVKINGKLLDRHISLKASDVNAVPTSRLEIGAGNVMLVDGAKITAVTRRITELEKKHDLDLHGAVPASRRINGYPLVGDVELAASDVGSVSVEDAFEDAPLPDVWAPLSDNLRLISGRGEEIKVGDDVVASKVSFSRASSATYVNKAGELVTAEPNEPRFEKEGLLIEGQSTNTLPISNPPISDNFWTKGAKAQWSDGGVGPDGKPCISVKGLNGITISSQESSLYCSLAPLGFGVETHTVSLWIKVTSAAEGARVVVRLSGDNNWVFPTEHPVLNIGKWVRVSATGLSSPNSSLVIGADRGSVDCEIFGIQLEALPFATSYIPTNGAAATRAKEVVSVNPENIPNTGGDISLATEFTTREVYPNFPRILEAQAVNGSPVYIAGAPRSDGRFSMCANFGSGSSYSKNVDRKGSYTCGISKQGGDFKVVLDGTIAQETKDNAYSGLSDLYLGCRPFSTRQLFGHLRNFRIWHRALNDNQLKGLR